MRRDGRAPDALRPVSLERGYTKHAAGSVLVSFGDTRVLCTASLEERIPPWLLGAGKGWVTAEYAMLPGSSAERIRRDHVNKGRAQEISRLIGRSLRGVVNLVQLGERQITIDCDVLQADGGTRTAAITGAYVALHDACRLLIDEGLIGGLPLSHPCAAVSAGVVGGAPMLDLCYEEDSAADVDMNVVVRGDGAYIEVQGCAEGEAFHRGVLGAMLDLADKGAAELFAIQKKALSNG